MQPRLPTWDNVDPTNPRQALQPALLDLPMQKQKITPPIDGPDGGTMGDWSEVLWNRGVRPHPELAKVKYVPPMRGPQHAGVNASGAWVDKDADVPDPIELMDLSKNTVAENEYYAEQLHYLGISHDPEAPPRLAEARVRSAPAAPSTFDPKQHTVAAVRAYLIDRPEHELRRVIAAEMASKKPRMSLLKHYPGV